jgi:C4-dicarboxylate transporter DctM subunit
LLGNILSRSQTAAILVEFFDGLFGFLPGGMALATVAVGVFFAGMVGSNAAEAAILAGILLDPMEKAGYPKAFTLGLIAAASSLGVIIPPSVPMIFYAALTGTSLGKLFIAGIVPGLFMALLIAITALGFSLWRGYGKRAFVGWSALGKRFVRSIPLLLVPGIIMGSIYLGWATPTESGSVAFLYLVLVGVFVYRTLNWKGIREALLSTVRTTSALVLVILVTEVLSFVLTYNQVSQGVVGLVTALALHGVAFVLAMTVVMLVLGIPLEAVPVIFVVVPLVGPILPTVGVNPIHFGIVVVVAVAVALITPPVGLVLLTLSSVSKVDARLVFRSVVPFYFVVLVGLFFIACFPILSLVLLQK